MPKMEASDGYQGLCLVAAQGRLYMHNYDALPAPVRNRLKNSPFNICAACVYQLAENQSTDPAITEAEFMAAIAQMERQILCEEIK